MVAILPGPRPDRGCPSNRGNAGDRRDGDTLYRWRHEARLPEDLAERVDALVIATMIHLMAQVTA
jgi:hypothetical protein